MAKCFRTNRIPAVYSQIQLKSMLVPDRCRQCGNPEAKDPWPVPPEAEMIAGLGRESQYTPHVSPNLAQILEKTVKSSSF